jgi:CRISPR-associated endonuclease/helicase Cas3
MDFLARPGQDLIEHLSNVSKNMIEVAKSLPISFSKVELTTIKYIGLMHDFGKFTSFFQKKLYGSKARHSSHSYASSIFLASFLDLSEIPVKLIIPAMMSVDGHHGRLTTFKKILPYEILNLENIFFEFLFKNHSDFSHQFNDIKENWKSIKHEFSKINIKLFEEMIDENYIINLSKRLLKEYKNLKKGVGYSDRDREVLALKTQFFYSLLVDSDQKDAAKIKNIHRKNIPKDLVDRYLAKKFSRDGSEINKLRSEFYKNVEANINNDKNILENKIFTITAPTGIGKTLTALNFALKLRTLKEEQLGYKPRIIYSLPYISIIEQVEKVFDDVLSLIPDYEKSKNDYLLPYHHLASYQDDENDVIDEINKKLLYDTWQSEIILTTFWQIVHTMIGFKSSLLKKFYTFAGSIIILDEVQAIPVEKLELIEKFLELLSSELESTFIIMTATKPIFKRIEAKELNAIIDKTFSFLNRTTIKKLYNFNEEDLEKILNNIDISNKSTLFIFNTIPESIEYFRKIKKYFKSREVLYISTNIVSKDRTKRIEKVRKLIKENRKPILVSTQVVEAGVDIDFDVVFRELGPIPSIIQAAGRCNRNYKKDYKSYIYLTNFDEKSSKKVYGIGHIQVALEILNELPTEIPEEMYKAIVEKYFYKLKNILSSNEAEKILNAYRTLNFYDESEISLKDFKIIDERQTTNVFVIQDESDEKIFELFLRILKEEDAYKKSFLFLKNRREIENRILRIPEFRAVKNLPPLIEYSKRLRFINKDSLCIYYDIETGFKFDFSEDNNEVIIW